MHVFSCLILGNFKSASTNETCNYLVIDGKTVIVVSFQMYITLQVAEAQLASFVCSRQLIG